MLFPFQGCFLESDWTIDPGHFITTILYQSQEGPTKVRSMYCKVFCGSTQHKSLGKNFGMCRIYIDWDPCLIQRGNYTKYDF